MLSGWRLAVVFVVWCCGGAKTRRRAGSAVSLVAEDLASPMGGEREREREPLGLRVRCGG